MRFVFFLAIFLMAMPLAAADAVGEESQKPEKTEATETKEPDYSKHAMMIFVWEIIQDNEEQVDPWVFRVSPLRARVGFQLASPMGVDTATFSAWPDPFAIAPVSAAYTPKTFRDRWGIWWTERRLGIKN